MNKGITDIKAEQILDSKKNPTLKVSVFVENIVGSFEVPSGAPRNKYEAHELRDGEDNKSGLSKAIYQIENTIKPALLGIDITSQFEIDKIMLDLDGTKQKTILGGNSMIGVSIAVAKTAAMIEKMETFEYLHTLKKIKPSRLIPYLYFNLISGGKHSSTKLAFQEYHVVPQCNSIQESIDMCKNIQSKLEGLLKEEFGELQTKSDEGVMLLPAEDVILPLGMLKKVVDDLGYTDKIKFALDVRASSFYNFKHDTYKFMDKDWTSDELLDLYRQVDLEFPIISIEDPFDEEDFNSFSKLQEIFSDVKVIGDNLTVTNIDRLEKAIKQKSIRGIIIKPNQIGTLSETLETMKLARDNDIDCIISHRSGETIDDFISDLAYAFGCFGIKAGALGTKERDVKYERLIKIAK